MNAYTYQAALTCEECAEAIRVRVMAKMYLATIDEIPQGPVPDGGGEADSPQHCGSCGTFLENPLTAEGVEYVRDELVLARLDGVDGHGSYSEQWRAFYAAELAEVTA